MNETINAEGVLDAIDFQFVPWGNAYYNTKKCYTPNFDKQNGMICWVKDCGSSNPDPSPDCFSAPILCQHGKEECDADKLEGCVIDLYPNPSVHGNFIVCYEGEGLSRDECGRRYGLNMTDVEGCTYSKKGAAIEARNAKLTANLGTSKLGTPWVLIDGVYLQDPGTMLKAVCDAIQKEGSEKLPAGCHF